MGVSRAGPQHEITDSMAWMLADANLMDAGLLRRRGPLTASSATGAASHTSRRIIGLARVQDPAGAEQDIMVTTKSGSTSEVNGFGANTSMAEPWPYTLAVSPYELFDAKDALLGGVMIGTAPDATMNPANRALQLWRGGSKASATNVSLSGAVSIGDATVVVTSATGITSGMHVFSHTGSHLIGVVKTISGTTLTLEHPALVAATTAVDFQPFRGLSLRIAQGRITCSSGDATGTVNGGLTKFKSQGMVGGSVWNLYTPDFTYIGAISTVDSDAQIHLAAAPTISLVNAEYIAIRVSGESYTGTPFGWLNAQFAGHQFYAEKNILRFSSYLDPEAVDLTLDGDFLIFSEDPIRAIIPTTASLIVVTENEAYALTGAVGTTPDRWRGERIHDDGTICTMSCMAYQGGAVWAGRRGIWFFDGNTPQNVAGQLDGDYNLWAAGNSGNGRAYACLVKNHLLMFQDSGTSGTWYRTKGATTTPITRPTFVVNLATGAVSIWTNVEIRGAVYPAGSQALGTALIGINSTIPDAIILDGTALFTDSGHDAYACDGSGLTATTIVPSSTVPGSPDLFVESKKYSMGDSQRLKLFRMFLLNYWADGGNLHFDVSPGLNTAGTTSPTEFWACTAYQDKRLKFNKKSQFLSFRIWQSLLSGDPSVGTTVGAATLAAGSSTATTTAIGYDDHYDGSSWAITTTGAVAAGEKLVAVVAHDGNTIGTTSIASDNENPTWRNVILDLANASSDSVSEVWEADGPLASGAVVTGTCLANHGITTLYRVQNVRQSGAIAAGLVATAHGSSDAPNSGATATAAAVGDAVIGYSHYDGAQTSPIPAAAFTQLNLKQSDFFLFIQQQLVAWRADLAGTATYSGTDGSGTNPFWQAGVVVVQSAAGTGVVTSTAHGLTNGQEVYFTTTGALMTGLSANTNYFVVNATTDTFKVSATLGGSAITFSGSQSGVHTLHKITVANTTRITLSSWALGFKWKRQGRV